MKIKKIIATVFNEPCVLNLMTFDNSDAIRWKELFDKWLELKKGLKDYRSREPNLPEGLSEVAFCLYSGSRRLLTLEGESSSSFDTYNLETERAEQIKATSISDDLSSFGPKSRWDDLYFLDFYNNGNIDGSFDCYKIPSSDIYKVKVNKNETFLDQQNQKRRPRFGIKKELIKPYNIKPIGVNIKVWKLL